MPTEFATSRPIPAGGYWILEIFLFKRQHGRAPAAALGADPKQGHPTATATGAGSRSVCRALGSWAIGRAPSQGGDNTAKTRCDPNAGSSCGPGGGDTKQRGAEKTDRVGTIGSPKPPKRHSTCACPYCRKPSSRAPPPPRRSA